ncbi:hypothetical protein [Brevibacillus choshinensis]|nr:hypothetical protein [Brevibacillus choshinensis]
MDKGILNNEFNAEKQEMITTISNKHTNDLEKSIRPILVTVFFYFRK